MKLWVTEKPDMAANLAAGLVRAYSISISNAKDWRREGFISMSNGDVIVPLSGHLMEMLPPDYYLTADQRRRSIFSIGVHPLLDAVLQKRVRAARASAAPVGVKGLPQQAPARPASWRFEILKGFVAKATSIINACDTDRAGQLIFDELMEELGVPAANRIQRIAIVSPKESDIAVLVTRPLERNDAPHWVRKREAALVRSGFDWRLGMILSRSMQVLVGIQDASVGRVQTAMLAMIARRNKEVDDFKPVTYYVPEVTMEDGAVVQWVARKDLAGKEGYDDEGRIISERVAAELIKKVNGGRLEVIEARLTRLKEAPPLPFSAGTLAATVARREGLELSAVEKAAQSLYSKHKAIYYVGTDCKFLPKSLLDEAARTIDAISQFYPGAAMQARPDLVSGAWNDSKVGDHHGIIPTGQAPGKMDDAERVVYKAICSRYLAQFRPASESDRHELTVGIDGHQFRAVRTVPVVMGWRDTESDANVSGEISEHVQYEGEADQQIDQSALHLDNAATTEVSSSEFIRSRRD